MVPEPKMTAETIIRGPVRIDWTELGEGWGGLGYDDTDPTDEELLRFDVFVWAPGVPGYEGWVEVRDSSYCTGFPASATLEQRKDGLRLLMARLYNAAVLGGCAEYAASVAPELHAAGLEVLREQPYLASWTDVKRRTHHLSWIDKSWLNGGDPWANWSWEDQAAAQAQGWNLFALDGDETRLQIQRLGTDFGEALFAADGFAVDFVTRMAGCGSSLHLRALRLHDAVLAAVVRPVAAGSG